MIYGKANEILKNDALDERQKEAVKIVSEVTPDTFAAGRREIWENEFRLGSAEYKTHAPSKIEAHRKYIDIMYVVDGEETIYVKPTFALSEIISEYDSEKDYLLASFDSDAVAYHLKAGDMLVLFPEDAHAPGCHPEDKENVDVKKICGKLLIKE